jgi:hypothetical protein
VDLQSIHKTSYFNRLAALPFRKLLIFNGLHPTAFKRPVLGCGTYFCRFPFDIHGSAAPGPAFALGMSAPLHQKKPRLNDRDECAAFPGRQRKTV